MRGFVALVLTLALLASAYAEAHLRVFVGGKPSGWATVSHRLGADGGKTVELRLELAAEGRKVTVHSLSTFDAKGNPLRKLLETSPPGSKRVDQVISTFPSEGASVVTILNGDRATKTVPLAPGAERADTTEFWFLRDKPKVGGKHKYFAFNMSTLEWETAEVVYVRDETITIGGRKVSAHRVESSHAGQKLVEWLDDAGLPYKLQDDQMTMERLS